MKEIFFDNNFFKSKRAVVIGGSGGIGKEISLALAARGASVTVHGGHASKKFDSLIKKMEQATLAFEASTQCGRKIQHKQIVLDFTKIDIANFDKIPAQQTDKVSACTRHSAEQSDPFRPLKASLKNADILCLCYGPFLRKTLAETTPREWLDITTQNFVLPGIIADYTAQFMQKRGFGRILFFGGTRTNAVNGFRQNAVYAAAKTAVASITKSFSLEYASRGISVSALFPGFVQTEYVSAADKKRYEAMLGAKMISAASVAQKALFLLSSPDTNGTLLTVDRSWTP